MSFKEKNWQLYKLKDIIQFNPKESIKKKEIAKKIAMDKLEPFTRKVSGYEETEFTSGTKFRNGDTLLARITPCLENGKTAQVDILDENEIGFGSTEYIVLREKLGITFNDYIYYLSISPEFRNMAIKSMTGSSGRQRVQKDVLEESEIILPILEEQKAIAKILSDLDEKIEVNNKINKNLEEMAQAIFKQWFVDFEFPNEEGKPYKSSGGEMVESELGMIPKGWKIFKLGDFIKFIKGKKPKKIEEKFFDGCELYLTIDVLNRNSEIFANKDKIIEVNDDDILMVMDGASSGSLYYGLNGILGSTLAKISVLNTIDKSFLYYYLKLNESSIKSHLTGSAIPHTDKEFINKLCLAIPNDEMILKKADTILNNIRNHTINLNTECSKIKKVRDTLLPKLMSGEIRVPLENSEN
ncbi:restriction endonuclease subunit S [Clostridium perfringens]|uniref:restriction endonuclease subunit S n=1 Tax=Clostridium perfringens TaxID=1502 RepID=UPI002AC425DC|nr:restriction endonuclease subunit S [Clostridium perfringens]MDZ4904289.1 restriction endonuclease subunit S [Clostridium perfringens]